MEVILFFRKKIIFEAKWTHKIERKLFSKRSKHIIKKENNFWIKANTFDNKKTSNSKQTIFEAKRTRSTVSMHWSLLFSKQSEHVRQKENYFGSEANTLDRKKIIFEAKLTH
jgi:hypothetical protein